MAEAFLRKHAGDYFDPHSAGTAPTQLHPLTVRVMNEVGVDMEGHRAKHLLEYLGRLPVRVLVIVCGEEDQRCPTIWPGVHSRLVWRFDDPAAFEGSEEERVQKFREVRDQVERQVKDWLTSVMQPAAMPAV
jgi:arsenate reductase